MQYIIFAYALALCAAQYSLGFVLAGIIPIRQAAATDAPATENPALIPVYFTLGLLVHLALVLVLKSLGAGWLVATCLPLVILLFAVGKVVRSWCLIVGGLRMIGQPLFVMWLVFQILLGASIFTLRDGISTPWVNNYGDLTFHLGMIHHFVLREQFPPDYHLYAGEPLSYPFLVNLWSALLWWPFATLPALKSVFVFQWVALWSCVYAGLARRHTFYLPWLLLFGGGSYIAIIAQPEVFSWRLIDAGYPWTTWLSTIWVTQRSALLGVVACLGATSLALNTLQLKGAAAWRLAFAGLILGLSPMAHAHYFLITALFLGLYFLAQSVIAMRGQDRRMLTLRGYFHSAPTRQLLVLVVFSLPALAFFPLLLGKSGMAGFMLGWTVPVLAPGWDSLTTSVGMWLKNAPQWFLVFCGLAFLGREKLGFTLLALLFVLANGVKLASWEWDQLKVFVAIFTLMLVLWNACLDARQATLKQVLIHSVMALLLVAPGAYEAWRIWRLAPSYQVYDARKLELAQLVREHVPPRAIVASPSDHNSAATLSGRTLFFGYPGTLASHNIAYRGREQVHLDLQKLRRCKKLPKVASASCPDYVIWGISGEKIWGRNAPGAGFTPIASTRDGRYHIYQVNEK